MGQIKIVANDDLIRRFKQIALIKHGKMELAVEGEEALRMYIQKHEHLLKKPLKPEEDPLNEVIGAVRSTGRRNALEELKRLDLGEL